MLLTGSDGGRSHGWSLERRTQRAMEGKLTERLRHPILKLGTEYLNRKVTQTWSYGTRNCATLALITHKVRIHSTEHSTTFHGQSRGRVDK